MSKDSSKPDSKPSKKSPPTGSSPKDGTELDLWDLDTEDLETPVTAPKESERDTAAIPGRRASESPIKSKKPAERLIDVPVLTETGADEAPAKKTSASKKQPRKSKPADEESRSHESNEETVDEAGANITIGESSLDTGDADYETKESDGEDRSQPAGKPIPSFLSSLSKSEKIGIAALVAILVVSATLAIIYFSTNVPTRSLIAEKLDLPVSGEVGLVTVTAVDTYWRIPVTSGENADVVRRGTMLVPVLKITLDAKPAALRILFRNEDGIVIGDAITRDVSGKSELTIPATAGFDDIGMHASYRTGGSRRWIVEVLEAANSNASRDKFKKLFETEISTDMRK